MPMFLRIFLAVLVVVLLLNFGVKWSAEWFFSAFDPESPYRYIATGLDNNVTLTFQSVISAFVITVQYYIISWGVHKYNTVFQKENTPNLQH